MNAVRGYGRGMDQIDVTQLTPIDLIRSRRGMLARIADELGLYVEDEGSFCWADATDDLRHTPRVMQLNAELLAREEIAHHGVKVHQARIHVLAKHLCGAVK